MTSSTSSLIMISLVSLFEWINEKLIVIVKWISHMSDFLRLFMISFKCGPILSRYFSTDSVLILSSSLSYSI